MCEGEGGDGGQGRAMSERLSVINELHHSKSRPIPVGKIQNEFIMLSGQRSRTEFYI